MKINTNENKRKIIYDLLVPLLEELKVNATGFTYLKLEFGADRLVDIEIRYCR